MLVFLQSQYRRHISLIISLLFLATSLLLPLLPFMGQPTNPHSNPYLGFILLADVPLELLQILAVFRLTPSKAKLLRITLFLLSTLSIVLYVEVLAYLFSDHKFILLFAIIKNTLASIRLMDPNFITLYMLISYLYYAIKFFLYYSPLYYFSVVHLLLALVVLKQISKRVRDSTRNYYHSYDQLLIHILNNLQIKACLFKQHQDHLKLSFISDVMNDQLSNSQDIHHFLSSLTLTHQSISILDEVHAQFQLLKLQNHSQEHTFKYSFQSNTEESKSPDSDSEVQLIFYKVINTFYSFLIFNNDFHSNSLKAIQELQIQIEYRDNFLASVTHDFKTPLNGMIALIEYLQNQLMDFQNQQLNLKCLIEDEKQYLKIILKNCYLILFMVDDIADFARMKNEKFELCYTQFFICDIVEEVIDLLITQCKQKGLQLNYESFIGKGLIVSDQNRIKQILLNLISNSMKFTQKGSIKILIQSDKQYMDQSKVIKISVKDTGIGMSEQVRKSLFQMYGTFNKHGLNKNGVGLGLVICKKIASQLCKSREMIVESYEGEGSTFSFFVSSNSQKRISQFLSFQYLEELQSERRNSRLVKECIYSYFRFVEVLTFWLGTHSPPYMKTKAITQKACLKTKDLIVEFREEFEKKLKSPGFGVKVVQLQYIGLTGASKMAQTKFYFYIFMDFTMPIMDGKEAASIIKNAITRKKIPPLKIIALTGYNNFEEKEQKEIFQYFDAFIPKPLNKAKVLEAIKLINFQ